MGYVKSAVAVICSVAVAVLCLCGCMTPHASYNRAAKQDTIRSYEDFLEAHPESPEADVARKRLETLRWEQVKNADSPLPLQEFLQNSPESRFAEEASARLEERRWETSRLTANETKNASICEQYLREYPRGRFASEARLLLHKLKEEKASSSWSEAARKDTVDAYNAVTGRHPDSRYASYARARTKAKQITTPEGMHQFLNRRGADTVEVFVSLPRFEELLVEDIARNGPGDRLVLTEGVPVLSTDTSYFSSDGSPQSMTLKMIPSGLLAPQAEFFGDNLSCGFTGFRRDERLRLRLTASPGSIHRYLGEVGVEKCTLVNDGDWRNRLTFAVVEGVGYVFLRGKGRVVAPDGTVIRLEGSTLMSSFGEACSVGDMFELAAARESAELTWGVGDDQRVLFRADGKQYDLTLHDAAEKGNIDKVRGLLRAGDEVDACDFFGRTPLSYAAMHGQLDVCRVLLHASAKADARVKGMTLLHMAVKSNNSKLAELLLINGADVNARVDGPDYTALHLAAMAGRHDMVKLLLDSGADASLIDISGQSPLDHASGAEAKAIKGLLKALAE